MVRVGAKRRFAETTAPQSAKKSFNFYGYFMKVHHVYAKVFQIII
jgi:hypothetical protein